MQSVGSTPMHIEENCFRCNQRSDPTQPMFMSFLQQISKNDVQPMTVSPSGEFGQRLSEWSSIIFGDPLRRNNSNIFLNSIFGLISIIGNYRLHVFPPTAIRWAN